MPLIVTENICAPVCTRLRAYHWTQTTWVDSGDGYLKAAFTFELFRCIVGRKWVTIWPVGRREAWLRHYRVTDLEAITRSLARIAALYPRPMPYTRGTP